MGWVHSLTRESFIIILEKKWDKTHIGVLGFDYICKSVLPAKHLKRQFVSCSWGDG